MLTSGAAVAQNASPAASAQAGASRTSQTIVLSEPLTLQQALARALKVNNTVERSRADVGAADANRKFLLSAVLPRVNLTAGTIRNSKEVSFGSPPNQSLVLPAFDWNYRIVLSQPVYAGRRELRAYEQAKIGVAIAQQAVLGTEDAVLLRVASTYLAMVNARALIEVEQKNIELAERRRVQADAFYKAGEVTRVDVLRAETAIKAAQRLLAVAQQSWSTAEGRLRADLDIDGPIAVVSPDRAMPPVPDEAQLIDGAAKSRPDVVQAVENLRAAELEVKKQRGFYLPLVTLDAGWVNQKVTFPTNRYTYGALRFTVPIWQSGEVEARVAQAKDRELQARLTLEDAKIAVREDVRKALVDLHEAETSLGLAREQLAAAEAEYQQAFELYRAQESTSLDLSSSETSLADARRSVAEETLNRDLSNLRVWYAAGLVKDALGVSASTTPRSAALPEVSEPESTKPQAAITAANENQ